MAIWMVTLLVMVMGASITHMASVPVQLAPANPYYIGASNPPPCCRSFKILNICIKALFFHRSNFPEEFGSCQVNEHCANPVAPYCSAFGYCTQVSQADS